MVLARLLMLTATTRALLTPSTTRPATLLARRMASTDRDGLEALTVPKLKDLLRSRNLKVGGTKSALVARLLNGGDAAATAAPFAARLVAPAVLIEACKS